MNSNIRRVVASFMLGGAAVVSARAQAWETCIDPNNNTPRNAAYDVAHISNELFHAAMGFDGTVTYGGANGPCFAPTAVTGNTRGRIGFAVGTVGSVQSSFDDNLNLTFGMPFDPAGSWSYATINRDKDAGGQDIRTTFGNTSAAFSVRFVGASGRYIMTQSVVNSVGVTCRIDLLGDTARIEWNLTNNDTAAAHAIGLWFGQCVMMLGAQADPATGVNVTGPIINPPFTTPGSKIDYVVVPSGKPPLTDTRWLRATSGSNFPTWVRFNFGQTTAYGFQIDNDATTSTPDQTPADEFVVGNASGLDGGLLNWPDGGDNTFPDRTQADRYFSNAAYIQKFNERQLGPLQSRTIVQYFHTTWGAADYKLPYAGVVDAPKLISTDDDGSGSNEQNGLFKNPFTMRVYVDNVRGYSSVNDGIALSDVKVKLTLPTGLNFTGFPTTTRSRQVTISQIAPKEMKSADFAVEADGIEFGDLPYQVDISPIPGPNKTIKGVVQVAATPRYRLFDAGGPTANATTTPFVFTDSSWDVVLGLSSPTDYEAYEWDPQVKGYIISTSAARGKGVFIINKTGSFQSNALGGNPITPPDTAPNQTDNNGRVVIQLKSGWNLIGNPYNYPITLSQISGVAAVNPNQSFGWTELVSQGILAGYLAYWDATTQSYKYLQNRTDRLLPNTAYWTFVNTAGDVTMSFPPVFAEFVPGSTRSVGDTWTQSDAQWRLQLAARSPKGVDDQNFVGKAPDTKSANLLRIMDPPMSPTQDVNLSIETPVNGVPTRLAQSLVERTGRQEFKVLVQSTAGGEVNVTWPNMSTVPKNVRFRLLDTVTNTSRDMRATSSYQFTADKNSTREFKVQVDLSGTIAPTIGNLIVARSGKDQSSPFSINYTLSTAATTTIRVISASGREVFTVTRGRADNAGQNSASWGLKDNANRTVAPGTYRIEVTVATTDGSTARKVVPVNITH